MSIVFVPVIVTKKQPQRWVPPVSQTMLLIPVAVTLDANGQATASLADGGAVVGYVKAVLTSPTNVASKLECGGFVDYDLDGTWETDGRPIPFAGNTATVTFDGGTKSAGVTGTVTFGVSPV